MSLPICQSLANHAFQGASGTPLIIHAKRDPVAVPEIKLGKVAVQVLQKSKNSRRTPRPAAKPRETPRRGAGIHVAIG
jgi:hypothetical protein